MRGEGGDEGRERREKEASRELLLLPVPSSWECPGMERITLGQRGKSGSLGLEGMKKRKKKERKGRKKLLGTKERGKGGGAKTSALLPRPLPSFPPPPSPFLFLSFFFFFFFLSFPFLDPGIDEPGNLGRERWRAQQEWWRQGDGSLSKNLLHP